MSEDGKPMEDVVKHSFSLSTGELSNPIDLSKVSDRAFLAEFMSRYDLYVVSDSCGCLWFCDENPHEKDQSGDWSLAGMNMLYASHVKDGIGHCTNLYNRIHGNTSGNTLTR